MGQRGRQVARDGSRRGAVGGALRAAGDFFGVIAGAALIGAVPLWVLGLYASLSALLFAVYGLDKAAARRDGWRTSESNLHLLALAGGWPGALIARQVFRHKTMKQPFRSVFWGTVVGNCLLLVVFLVVSSGVV